MHSAATHSAAVLQYVVEHMRASRRIETDGQLDRDLLRKLDGDCVAAIRWIEADWDRNRFADDPYKADLNRTGQHLLDHFERMHAYHQHLLDLATP